MRRSTLKSIAVMSLTALSVAIGACATAPIDDDLSGLTQEQNPAQPNEEEAPSAKLPPASSPSDPAPTDAGTDAKPPTKDAAPPKDASTPPADSGPPPTTGGDCDSSDPTYYLKFIMASNPTPCPCVATECCYLSVACVEK